MSDVPDVTRQKWRLRLLQLMLFERFDISRILETWKFPARFLHGERLERLERSEAVKRLELAFVFGKTFNDAYFANRRAAEKMRVSFRAAHISVRPFPLMFINRID